MKVKLAVITLCVLACSAAFAQAGSATLGFTNYADTSLFCNYEKIQWNGFYMQGIDNLSACGAPTNATIEGFKANGSGLTGLVYAYADNLLDAIYGSYTGEQWLVLTQTKPSKLLKQYGWVGYLGFDGYEFFGGHGYLSASIPGQSPKKPVSGEHTASAAHQSQNRIKVIPK